MQKEHLCDEYIFEHDIRRQITVFQKMASKEWIIK